jgi:hypothetical protein
MIFLTFYSLHKKKPSSPGQDRRRQTLGILAFGKAKGLVKYAERQLAFEVLNSREQFLQGLRRVQLG